MALGADRYASRGDTFAFLGCVLLSVAAMSLPERVRDPLARGLRQTVLAPFLALQQQTELLSASLERYDAVVAQRDSAALAATFLPELRGENIRLRGLLGLGTRLSSCRAWPTGSSCPPARSSSRRAWGACCRAAFRSARWWESRGKRKDGNAPTSSGPPSTPRPSRT